MKNLKVHLLYEHAADGRPFGCSYIRLIQPLTHPTIEESFDLTYSTDYRRADLVIVERSWRPNTTLEQAGKLVRRIRKRKSRLIFTLDDNLLDLENVPMDAKMVMRYFAREADGILVSTEKLKKRMLRLNDTVLIIPNQVDDRLFMAARNREKPFRNGRRVIGFMGTFTHESDLMMVFQALRAVLRKYAPKIEFQLVGGVSDPGVIRTFNDLPFHVLRVPHEKVAYPNFIPWMAENVDWDLAIAPLEDTTFNSFKSDIKYLDYSALGIPGIYSQMSVYESTVEHMVNGYLAPNTPDAWTEAIERLLMDDELLSTLANNAQEYVFSRRTLAQHAVKWRDAIMEIRG